MPHAACFTCTVMFTPNSEVFSYCVTSYCSSMFLPLYFCIYLCFVCECVLLRSHNLLGYSSISVAALETSTQVSVRYVQMFCLHIYLQLHKYAILMYVQRGRKNQPSLVTIKHLFCNLDHESELDCTHMLKCNWDNV